MDAAPRDPVDAVIDYHERTKHRPDRYARSLGYMDWATQPDPFRRYFGAVLIGLDLMEPRVRPAGAESIPYDALDNPPTIPARALDRSSLSQLLYDSLALSAWKEHGASRWSLRVNPSSGNLHPTEGYVISGPVPGVTDTPAVMHYAPHEHALEVRRRLSDDQWRALVRGLPAGSLFVGLTSIHWRESWKYGERAYRYCQHDAGHAVGAVATAAAVLGWTAHLLPAIGDEELAILLGTQGQPEQLGPEAEHPDCLMAIVPAPARPGRDRQGAFLRGRPDPAVLTALRSASLLGTPNALSTDHHNWPVIDRVARACVRPPGAPHQDAKTSEAASTAFVPNAVHAESLPDGRGSDHPIPARRIIRQRRSALAMDSATSLTRDAFLRMLRRIMPGAAPALRPLNGIWPPCIHPLLFVHRVQGLNSGLYLLTRDETERDHLRAAMRRDFIWERAAEDLPLDMLLPIDCRQAAQTVSCHQEIAADGAFAVAMLARFEPTLREHGAWAYRLLHWEAGAIGQVLYLEAEAAAVRSTGIGCFFDDLVHQMLGLSDPRYQTLYHFAVGGAVEDPRLRSAPAYDHLDAGR